MESIETTIGLVILAANLLVLFANLTFGLRHMRYIGKELDCLKKNWDLLTERTIALIDLESMLRGKEKN